MSTSNFFSSTTNIDNNLSNSNSKAGTKGQIALSNAQGQNLSEKRTQYMQDIRRNAREEITKQRRQQPNIFSTANTTNAVNTEEDDLTSRFDYLGKTANREELIKNLVEFEDIDVVDFGEEEIDQIANTLKNGEM
jgi:translation initiation factor 2B subunit (eIF-2B alpha/beta/delta family)